MTIPPEQAKPLGKVKSGDKVCVYGTVDSSGKDGVGVKVTSCEKMDDKSEANEPIPKKPKGGRSPALEKAISGAY